MDTPDVVLPHDPLETTDLSPAGGAYQLSLFVTGLTPRSIVAIARIKAICEEYLGGRYDLEVIDIYQQPAVVKDEQILATPTLIKKHPLPLRRLVGDLSDKWRVLQGLNILDR
jgi:circadian clock protein KaiB